MNRVTERFFDAMSVSTIGKIIASMAICGALPLMLYADLAENLDPADIPTYCIGGAVVGFFAAILLLWPRVIGGLVLLFLGTVFLLIGGTQFFTDEEISVGVAAFFLPFGLAFWGGAFAAFRSQWRRAMR